MEQDRDNDDYLVDAADDDAYLNEGEPAGDYAEAGVQSDDYAENVEEIPLDYGEILYGDDSYVEPSTTFGSVNDALGEVELIQQVDDEALSEKILDSHRAYNGSFLKVDDVDIELPNGNRKVHQVIRHPGAVAVIALDGEGRVLLVRQYRTALERVTVEIPAGKLEIGEDPEEAIRRELSEETGYTAAEIRYLAPIATAVGYSDEIIHIYMATGLTPGAAHPDDDEFLASEWVSLDCLIDSVLDGRIEDSKTVIAALICDALRHRL